MIENIKKRLEVASPGPWKWIEKHEDDAYDSGGFIGPDGTRICNFGNNETYYPTAGDEPYETDIDFIANAHADIEYLLEQNRKLVEALKEIANMDIDRPDAYPLMKIASKALQDIEERDLPL